MKVQTNHDNTGERTRISVAHGRPLAGCASPSSVSGTPTEHVLASTGCHTGLRRGVHFSSFFPVLGSVKSLWVFVFAHFSDLESL